MESKIELTHRLEREGRWEEASLFRDQVRQRLKREGKTRQEANEGAWQAMAERYPPIPECRLPDFHARRWLLNAHLILDVPVGPDGLALNHWWWVLCHIRAMALFWVANDATGCRFVQHHLFLQAPSLEASRMALAAIEFPTAFLRRASKSLEDAANRLDQADPCFEALEEMRDCLGTIERLEMRWPGIQTICFDETRDLADYLNPGPSSENLGEVFTHAREAISSSGGSGRSSAAKAP